MSAPARQLRLLEAMQAAAALVYGLRPQDPVPFDVEVAATSAEYVSITLHYGDEFGADVVAVDNLAARLKLLQTQQTRPGVTFWRSVDGHGNVLALAHVRRQEVPACSASPSSA